MVNLDSSFNDSFVLYIKAKCCLRLVYILWYTNTKININIKKDNYYPGYESCNIVRTKDKVNHNIIPLLSIFTRIDSC